MARTTTYRVNSAASTNAANIKVGAGIVYSITVSNQVATLHTVKLYDLAVAPTVGTSVPVVHVTGGATVGATNFYDFGPNGTKFDTGISIAVLGGATSPLDNDTGVATVNAVKVTVNYK